MTEAPPPPHGPAPHRDDDLPQEKTQVKLDLIVGVSLLRRDGKVLCSLRPIRDPRECVLVCVHVCVSVLV